MDNDVDWSYWIDVELPDVETIYRASNAALNRVIWLCCIISKQISNKGIESYSQINW